MRREGKAEQRIQALGLRHWKLGLCLQRGFPSSVLGISALKWSGIPCPGFGGGDPAREDSPRQSWAEIPCSSSGHELFALKKGQKLLGLCSNGTLEDLVIIPGNLWLVLNPSASLDLVDSWSKEIHVLTTQFGFKKPTNPTKPWPALPLNLLPFCSDRKNSGALLITFLSLISLHLVSSYFFLLWSTQNQSAQSPLFPWKPPQLSNISNILPELLVCSFVFSPHLFLMQGRESEELHLSAS